jgi:uncharacterized protein YgbK (DUF1537 family)
MKIQNLASGTVNSRIFMLADDLTGANDTAIQFVKEGSSALVITNIAEIKGLDFKHYDVVSINSNSRGMRPQDAYKAIYNTISELKPNEKGYFVYKKIDSVLRGNPGQELAAVMDVLNVPLALVAPSFPANRSIIENGRLFSRGSSDSGGINAIQIFADQTGRKTENIPLEEIRQGVENTAGFINTRNKNGTQVFIADAVTDSDLEIIYKASTFLSAHIMAGSAGLANQLARHQNKVNAVSFNKPSLLYPVLIIAGTRQGETASQIHHLSHVFQVPVIKFDVRLAAENKIEEAGSKAYDEVTRYMKENRRLCVIAVESMFTSEFPAGETVSGCATCGIAEGDDVSAAISVGLGVLTAKLMDSFHFPVIISTGGDTSLGICKQLGIKTMEPLTEICPGIPLCRVTGGAYDGSFIVTKSGRFGNPNSIVEIINYLEVNV